MPGRSRRRERPRTAWEAVDAGGEGPAGLFLCRWQRSMGMTKNRRRKAAPVPRGRRTAPRPAPCGPVSPGGRVRAVRPRADAYAELCLSNTAEPAGYAEKRARPVRPPRPRAWRSGPSPPPERSRFRQYTTLRGKSTAFFVEEERRGEERRRRMGRGHGGAGRERCGGRGG